MKYLNIAANLAYRNIGCTGSNPSVGAVLVRDNTIIAYGVTGVAGVPHAETQAISMAGNCEGASLYVTLEPCSHIGKTPPCADAIIAAGITHVVIGNLDISDKVESLDKLKQAGIKVEIASCDASGISGFTMVEKQERPYITAKIATSIDAKIATNTGDSKWITGNVARRYAHKLRQQNDAIMVGSNTWLIDKSSLDCRIDGLQQYSPLRVVADRNSRCEGADIIVNQADIHHQIQYLTSQGITRLLVEGGGRLIAELLQNNLIDELHIITASIIIGQDGIASIGDLGLDNISQASGWSLMQTRKLGDDILHIYRRLGN